MARRKHALFVGPLLALGLASQGFAQDAQEAPPQITKPDLTLDLGDGTTVTLYGYVKVDFIQDRDFDLGDTTVGLKNIGLPGGPAPGEHDRVHAKETRIGIDVKRGDLFAKFEGDFFGKNGNLRLRHAYVDWQGFQIGQNWTNFMSVANLPKTVDFQGPAGIPFSRRPQLRYTWQNGGRLTVSGSLEEDPTNTDDVMFTLAAKQELDWGFLRASGVWRDYKLGTQPVNGWGINLATVADVWSGGEIRAAVTGGKAISDLLAFGLNGTALYDGDEVGVQGLTIGFTQKVGPKVTLAAAYGLTNLERATGTDTKKLQTLHLGAFYDFNEVFGVALEYYTGKRTQGDGVSFDADRIQFAAKASF